MKKLKQKIFVINWIVFPFDVLVCLGSTREQIIKYIERLGYKPSKRDIEEIQMYGTGRSVLLDNGATLLWTKCYPRQGSGVLAHEIFHAVTFVLHHIGVEFDSNKSGEVYAYMIQYLTNEINGQLNK